MEIEIILQGMRFETKANNTKTIGKLYLDFVHEGTVITDGLWGRGISRRKQFIFQQQAY